MIIQTYESSQENMEWYEILIISKILKIELSSPNRKNDSSQWEPLTGATIGWINLKYLLSDIQKISL